MLLTGWLALLCSLPVMAQTQDTLRYVRVTDEAGAHTWFALEDKPTVTITAENWVLTAGDAQLLFPLSQQVVLDFESEGMAVVNTEAERLFRVADKELIGRNLTPRCTIRIADMRGNIVLSTIADGQGNCRLSLHELPIGLYVVSADGMGVKFGIRN